jgi:hypothetical protein
MVNNDANYSDYDMEEFDESDMYEDDYFVEDGIDVKIDEVVQWENARKISVIIKGITEILGDMLWALEKTIHDDL